MDDDLPYCISAIGSIISLIGISVVAFLYSMGIKSIWTNVLIVVFGVFLLFAIIMPFLLGIANIVEMQDELNKDNMWR